MSAIQHRSAFVPHDLKRPILGAKSGPLAGLTVAIKDMYDIAGERSGGGNPDWLQHQTPASANCPTLQRLLDAGATIIGKTICEEFFFSVTGINAHYGTPVNVRAPGRVPGGSSSGSASAAASGACDFALGSDTGGSVRIPAALCGLYGIRPTHGRVDLTGAMAMAPSFDVAGWFTTGPGLLRRIGPVLLGGKSTPHKVQSIVILDDAFAAADAEIAALVKSALAAMSDVLPTPHSDVAAPGGFDVWRECFRVLQGKEIWAVYGDFVTRYNPVLGPGVRERMQFAASVTDSAAASANDIRRRARERAYALAKPGTVLALPTSPSIAPRVDASQSELDDFRGRVMRLTCTSTLSGLPQITIPVGTVSGCPVGLSFIGWAGGDESLLDLAVMLSRYCGFEA